MLKQVGELKDDRLVRQTMPATACPGIPDMTCPSVNGLCVEICTPWRMLASHVRG
jgi:hypothetical protein